MNEIVIDRRLLESFLAIANDELAQDSLDSWHRGYYQGYAKGFKTILRLADMQ